MSQLLHLFTLFTDTEVKWKTITVLKSMNLIDGDGVPEIMWAS